MVHTGKSELRERLSAYSATLQSSSRAALKHAAENWPRYAAVTCSALAMATNGSAQVIYSGTRNLTAGPIASVGLPGGSSANTSAHNNALLKGTAGFSIGVRQGVGESFLNGYAKVNGLGGLEFLDVGSLFNLQKLGKSVNVSTAPGHFESAGFLATVHGNVSGLGGAGIWAPGQTSFAGFRFTTAGSNVDYGWVRLVYTDSSGNGAPNQITAVDWAYGANGTPVTTGEGIPSSSTPEPSTATLSMLAAGAAGVAALRRRRKAAA